MTQPAVEATAVVRLAGFWRRFAGLVVDGVVAAIVTVLLVTGGLGPLGVLAGPAYWIVLVAVWDRTIGMRAVGIRLVRADSGRGPIGWGTATVRYLMQLVSGFVFGLGYLWAAWDRRRQTWHDHVAGTLAVLEEAPAASVTVA